MDVLLSILTALLAGSIGVLVTLAFSSAEAVRRHNSLVKNTDADLAQWVSDECVQLERAIQRVRNKMASAGQGTSGAYLEAVAHLKEETLHRYRDRETEAGRAVQAVRDGEGVGHRLLRRSRRFGPMPELETPGKVGPVLDGWRAQVRTDWGTAPVSDPTKRPLSWALGKYGSPDAYDQFV